MMITAVCEQTLGLADTSIEAGVGVGDTARCRMRGAPVAESLPAVEMPAVDDIGQADGGDDDPTGSVASVGPECAHALHAGIPGHRRKCRPTWGYAGVHGDLWLKFGIERLPSGA